MKKMFLLMFTAATIAVSAGVASAASIDYAVSEVNQTVPSDIGMRTTGTNMVPPLFDKAPKLIVAASECCPAGYPWYRNSTGRCYSSQSDCRDTNGGGWSCRMVNQCK